MNKVNLIAYRIRVRKEINKLPKELIDITLDECKKALERKK